jgi:C-terminal processing protease CtpA/Prc
LFRKLLPISLLVVSFAGSNYAQLSPYQKNLDFQELVALFNKDYAFIEWKNQAFGYNGLNLSPWLAQVSAGTDDLSYFDAAALYAASFQDSHTVYLTPSTFYALLGFTVDIYGGKVLIDSIDRTILKASRYPFQVGDELVSVDGKPVADWIALFTPFVNDASPISRKRTAAGMIVERDQEFYPHATDIGTTATVAINRQNGTTATYTIPWLVYGIPYQSPLLPDPTLPGPSVTRQPAQKRTPVPVTEAGQLKRRMRVFRAQTARYSLGAGDYKPFFSMPAGFKIHTGTSAYDSLFSGSFQAGGYTIAYIRIPDFTIYSDDVQSEITYFTKTVPTDGLIFDLMRNPGGDACTAESIASILSSQPLLSMQLKERVTFADIMNIQMALYYDQLLGTQDDIDFDNRVLAAFQAAYSQSRGFTDPLSLCGYTNQLAPATDSEGVQIAYTKPVMLLLDEETASAAELLAGIMQDNHAALLYGMTTNGAGGRVESLPTGSYTEGTVYMARAILIRNTVQSADGLPSEPYIENFGVQPDITDDYMTADNLAKKGAAFVTGFTNAMVNYIQSRNGQ